MTSEEEIALAAIDARYSELVLYKGGGSASPQALMVVWSDVKGDPFQGAGNTTRIVTAEVQQSDLPTRPAKADRLVREGATWQPNDVTRRDDIGKWEIILERSE